ncbi:MAG: guanylate kinase [Gammaproteobacteria bacterium]|nr:guanylate kinase [Gammaproteobacteria bacterium]
MEKLGTVYIVAAASGTGKTSLVKVLVESLNNIIISISHTTRPKRSTERNGENYFFVSKPDFQHMIANQEFLEYANVFGHYYGTSKTWVTDQLQQGMDVILEIDWQGAEQIKKLLPECVSIFILPPSMNELKHRLETRNQDDPVVIAKRLSIAGSEIKHSTAFDYIVVNDQFDIALVDLRSIIRAQRLRKDIQRIKQDKLLSELID